MSMPRGRSATFGETLKLYIYLGLALDGERFRAKVPFL